MFPVLFAIPRVAGWLAHWNEFLDDTENKIVRPRQHYVGYGKRNYVGFNERQNVKILFYFIIFLGTRFSNRNTLFLIWDKKKCSY